MKNGSEIQDVSHPHDSFTEERIAKTTRGVFGFFITRSRLTLLVIFAIIFGGVVALLELPRESDPEVKIPLAIVTTIFPGASPSDVEELVTDEIENKIEELDDVRLVTSSSVTSLSAIVVEFEAEADLDDSIQELKNVVDEVIALPDDAENPVVEQIRVSDTPIVTLSLAGKLTENEFKDLAENVQDELEKISGVSRVSLAGVREREISVQVDRGEIERLHIPLGAVVVAIRSSNSNTPLGSVTLDAAEYNIRSVAELDTIEDIKKLVVTMVGGTPILLEDIAEVHDGFVERSSISRISLSGKAPEPTVSLSVFKKTGGNILDIVDTSKARLVQLQEEGIIPQNVAIETSSDFSVFIRKDLNTLGRSGIQAAILIFLIMFVALSIREAFISFLAIPLTFFITFFVLLLYGFTLNSLTLFVLVLSLGLLVDTFIIILEGVFHNLRAGYSAQEAALLSVSHYKKPLFSGIFTTISAFVPMLLVSGILGEFLRLLPITLSIILISSLFVSLVIVPSIASVLLRRKKTQGPPKISPLEKYITLALIEKYKKSMKVFLQSKKAMRGFLAVMVILFISSFGILVSGAVPVELFPEVDIEFSFINVEMPIGTTLEDTDSVVREVEEILLERNDIKTFVSSIGSSMSFGFGEGSSSGEHLANINITFADKVDRDLASYEINDELREALKNISRGTITIQEISGGPPTGAPVEVRVSGSDLPVLEELTALVTRLLKETPGTFDIEADRDVSPADMVFTLKQDALARSGLSIAEVSGFLRTALFGLTATEVTFDGDDVDVVVSMHMTDTDSIEEISNLSLITSTGESIKLSRVADFSLEPALAAIRHRDFERTITIRSNLERGFTPASVVLQIEERLKSEKVPVGYTINFGGEVEDIEQSFSELWRAMIVALLLIVFILVLQFNSFKKPLVILFSLPFILIGVVVGMLLFGLPFSFSVFLGLISLTGIAVNDAIVLLDKAERNRKELNMLPQEAIACAGETRLQPILLTSITTIAGIVPLAFADEFWFGLSISIAFGLAFTTIIQLYMVPLWYTYLKAGKD